MDSYEPVKAVLVDAASGPFASGGNGLRGHPRIGEEESSLNCGVETSMSRPR